MAVNAALIKTFLDATIKPNSQDGLILGNLAVLYNEFNSRRGSNERAQSVSFYPLVELYCIFHNNQARIEYFGNSRRIRGFSFKTEEINRLVNIYVNGTGASADNLESINEYFKPLMGLTPGE